jgi:diphthine methyl ester synthase
VKEQNEENLMKGKKIYEPPRFMTINQALEQLMEVEEKRKEKVLSKDTQVIGLARIGAPDQLIKSGTVEELLKVDFGEPLHSLVICGSLHIIEEEILSFYKK